MLGRSFTKIPLRHQSNSHPNRARCAREDTRCRTPTSRSSTAAKLPGTWGEGESIFSSQNGAGAPHTALCSGTSPRDGSDNHGELVLTDDECVKDQRSCQGTTPPYRRNTGRTTQAIRHRIEGRLQLPQSILSVATRIKADRNFLRSTDTALH